VVFVSRAFAVQLAPGGRELRRQGRVRRLQVVALGLQLGDLVRLAVVGRVAAARERDGEDGEQHREEDDRPHAACPER
jgi:hypothetical protein